MRVAIIGGGSWGRALYGALSQKAEVVMVSRARREGFVQVGLQEALGMADFLVLAIATSSLRAWLKEARLPAHAKILAACKGIEEGSGALVSEILSEVLPRQNLAYLAGPSFATEVERHLPCALVIHAVSLELAHEMASVFPSWIRIYTDPDMIGGEVAGAYKNVIAIASGVCDGLGLGNNAKASIMARGLVEMARFGKALGANVETFLGLSGAGDLFLTSSSTLSRNYRVGLGLAQGKKLEVIIEELGEVAEGVKTARAIVEIATMRGIHVPLALEVSRVLEGKDLKQSLQDILMLGR